MGQIADRMRAAIGVTWSDNPLRSAVNRLSETQDVAIWLDRRVDPDQKMEFAARDVPLEHFLLQLAKKLSMRMSQIGSVAVIGPRETVDKLATVNALREQEVKNLPAATRTALMRRRASRWDDLTTPRELIEQLAKETNIRIVGIEQFPHDLWAANHLPPLTFCERLTLIGAGFDITFEFSPDGSAVRFAHMPATATLEEIYELKSADQATELAKLFPNATLRSQGLKLQVAGSFEDHAAIRRLIRGEAVRRPADPGPPGAKKLYSIKFENQPAGAVANTVAKQLNLKLVYAPEVKPQMEMLVSVDVTDVELDELMKAALGPVNLTYNITGSTLEVVAAE